MEHNAKMFRSGSDFSFLAKISKCQQSCILGGESGAVRSVTGEETGCHSCIFIAGVQMSPT